MHLFDFSLGAAIALAVAAPIAFLWLRRARRAEEEARRSQRLAELGSMTSGLAHEIKNPLSTVGLNAQLLIEDLRGADLEPAEADRMVRPTGDVIVVFDFSQSQAMQQMAQAGLDSVNQIRVTIYELPGSHLVWAGWSLMLLGSCMLITHSGRTSE